MANTSAQRRLPGNGGQTPPPSFGGTLGIIAIAFGVGVLGAYMLDLHAHTCCKCGHKWRHLGAFNLGDADAHTCRNCGEVQWWKCGWQRPDGAKDGAFRPYKRPAVRTMQELREDHQLALPSMTFAAWPRESRG